MRYARSRDSMKRGHVTLMYQKEKKKKPITHVGYVSARSITPGRIYASDNLDVTCVLEILCGRGDGINTPYCVFTELFKARAADALRVFVLQRGGGARAPSGRYKGNIGAGLDSLKVSAGPLLFFLLTTASSY